jgi:uncharacterized protein (DUF1778 family)
MAPELSTPPAFYLRNDKCIGFAKVTSEVTMDAVSERTAKRDTLNLRIKPEIRLLIDRAAALTGKSRTDFLLEAGRRAAEEALLDRAFLQVSPEAYTAFLDRLDMPPTPNDRLRRTMAAPLPWGK